jgi:hypothetical protein
MSNGPVTELVKESRGIDGYIRLPEKYVLGKAAELDAHLAEPRYTVRQVAEAMVQREFGDPGIPSPFNVCATCPLDLCDSGCTAEQCLALLVPRLEALVEGEEKADD